MSRRIVLGVVIAGSVAACAFVIGVLVRKGLTEAGVWAGVVAALAGVVAAAAALLVLAPRPSKAKLTPELKVPEWAVGRPAEMAAAVKALVDGRARTVGITTGLYGAGGFGKTTLAQMVCADRRVRRRFGGRVYMVTVGRDVRGSAAILAKVQDVIKLVSDEDATFSNPQLAGQRLGSLLDDGPRKLLVLDDVWEPEQLAPFMEGGKACARLVTTRVPELLAGRGVPVQVDQMSPEQARAVLTSGLPDLEPTVIQGLLALTGRWPLLLRLVNKILADYAQVATDVSVQGAILLERLRAGGPAVVDDLLGEVDHGLDVNQPQERARAVRATIEASISLLDRHDAERFAELSVFAEDETIPFSLVARLWQATAGLEHLQAAQVCKRLAQLALVSRASSSDRGITLHDVVREFLRAELGQRRIAELNDILLETIAADLLEASSLNPETPRPAHVAWWEMRPNDRYLWDHLIEHLLDAQRPGEAEAVAGDLRWVGARLERFGPAAPTADLSAVGTVQAARLRVALTRTAHLLAPTEPPSAVVDILHSRLAGDSVWGVQVAALHGICRRTRLVNHWPLPDLADSALRRVLTGHSGRALGIVVAVSPDGSWIASGSADGTVRIWDVTTGQERAALKSDTRKTAVTAVAIAADGSWIASGGWDGIVRIWDVATGRERSTIKGHSGSVTALAVSPDGSWIASGSADGTVRIWDVATGQERSTFRGDSRRVEGVTALAVSPDSSWLVTGGRDQTLRVWDVASGKVRAILKSDSRGQEPMTIAEVTRTTAITGIAVASDGAWLVTSNENQPVRIWEAATWQEWAVLTEDIGGVNAVAVSPNGNWLATGSADQTVRIWDMVTGQERATLTGHKREVTAVAVSPDGRWLASGSGDQTVRIWDVAAGREQATLTRYARGVNAVAASPNGNWLATGCRDGTVRIWDVDTGEECAILMGHARGVNALAVAPDGSWLATGSDDWTVRIWDMATRQERATLKRHIGRLTTMAVAPDGSWLATGSRNRTARIWDVATGRIRATLKGDAQRETVAVMTVSSSGNWLATACAEGTVRIWDAATGHEHATLTGHTQALEAVTAMAASEDGRWLATGSRDQTVRIWDVATMQVRTVMRLDNSLDAATWLGVNMLAIGGSAGMYIFEFLTCERAGLMPPAD